jgi:hypothetical protein
MTIFSIAGASRSDLSASKNRIASSCPPANLVAITQPRTNPRRSLFFEVPNRLFQHYPSKSASLFGTCISPFFWERDMVRRRARWPRGAICFRTVRYRSHGASRSSQRRWEHFSTPARRAIWSCSACRLPKLHRASSAIRAATTPTTACAGARRRRVAVSSPIAGAAQRRLARGLPRAAAWMPSSARFGCFADVLLDFTAADALGTGIDVL